MPVEEQDAGRKTRRLGIDLRSLFLMTFSLAVGLAVGAAPAEHDAVDSPYYTGDTQLDWHFALLATATTSIAITLLKEAYTLHQRRATGTERTYQFGFVVEAIGRAALAMILLASLAVRLLVERGLIVLPEDETGLYSYGDVMTTHVWWLALGIALTERLQLLKSPREHRPRRIISTLTTLAAVALGAYVLWERLAVTFLVHLACRGVDAYQPGVYQRYVWPSRAEEVKLTSLAVLAFASVLLAAVCFGRAARQAPGAKRRLLFSFGTLLLLGAAAYSAWFQWRVMPAISPDLAEVGGSGTWFEFLGGGILAGTAVCYAAYRVARADGADSYSVGERVLTGYGVTFSTAMLVLAAIVYFEQYVRSMLDYASTTGYMGLMDIIAYSLVIPDTYFMFALTLLSIHLAWIAWRRKNVSTLIVHPVEGRRFAMALLAFTALTIVAIPTLLAAGLGFLMGPWYRW